MATIDNLKKWDSYYYNICIDVSKQSSCLSRKIGTVLVRDKTIIGTGYNGPARGIPHCNERYHIDQELRAYLKSRNINPDDIRHHKMCPRYTCGFKSGEGLEWCIAGHAERNAIVNSAREGISTKGATLYMSCGIPCKDCLTEIVNSGIVEIVVTKFMFYDAASKYLLENSNLKYRLFSNLINLKEKGVNY